MFFHDSVILSNYGEFVNNINDFIGGHRVLGDF